MVFCGKCGTENPDDNRFCNKCGSLLGKEQEKAFVEDFAKQHSGPGPVKVTEIAPHVYRVRSKYLGPALVAFFILAVAALGIYALMEDSEDSYEGVYDTPSYTASYTASQRTNSNQSLYWSGSIELSVVDGVITSYVPYHSVLTADQMTGRPTSIIKYSVDPQESHAPLPPGRNVWDKMQDSFDFLKGSESCNVIKTFTDGDTRVEAYKFSFDDGDRCFYVGKDGKIYRIFEIYTMNGHTCKYDFILDGWRQA